MKDGCQSFQMISTTKNCCCYIVNYFEATSSAINMPTQITVKPVCNDHLYYKLD